MVSGNTAGAHHGAATGRGRAVRAEDGRTAHRRVETGGQGKDAGDRTACLRAAGGGDDRHREFAAAGPELHGAGLRLCQAEPGFQNDAGANWGASGPVARVSVELHAAAEAAAERDTVPERGPVGI